MADPVSALIDPAPWIGTGAAGFGFATTFAQVSPVVTFALAVIVSTLTIAYLIRRLKNGKLSAQNLRLAFQTHS